MIMYVLYYWSVNLFIVLLNKAYIFNGTCKLKSKSSLTRIGVFYSWAIGRRSPFSVYERSSRMLLITCTFFCFFMNFYGRIALSIEWASVVLIIAFYSVKAPYNFEEYMDCIINNFGTRTIQACNNYLIFLPEKPKVMHERQSTALPYFPVLAKQKDVMSIELYLQVALIVDCAWICVVGGNRR